MRVLLSTWFYLHKTSKGIADGAGVAEMRLSKVNRKQTRDSL